MKQIKFTDDEIVVMRQILDLALRTQGREVVKAFIVLDNKFANAEVVTPDD
jgi:hypothetical protein